MKKEVTALCHRCEWRAQHRELGHAPRYECGTRGAVWSCYMYKPVCPIIIQKNDDDQRDMFAPYMVSARSHRVGLAEENMDIDVMKLDSGYVMYWKPTEKKTIDDFKE